MCARPLLLCLAFGLLTACSDPPDLPDRPDSGVINAPYPALAPIETLLSMQKDDPEADAQVAQTVDARIANLQARATRLQSTSGIDDATRSRLNRQISTD